jgi:outer membrane protein assembly factor BamB
MIIISRNALVSIYLMTALIASAQKSKLSPDWIAKATFPSYVYISNDGNTVTAMNYEGIETFGNEDGVSIMTADRKKWFSRLSDTNVLSALNENIKYLYVPHIHAALEFNDGIVNKEIITLIDLSTADVIWQINGLEWSKSRYATAVKGASKLASKLGVLQGAAASDAAEIGTAIALPEKELEQIAYIIPEENALFLKTFPGAALIDLETGKVKWQTSGLEGTIATASYYSSDRDLVVVGDASSIFAGANAQRDLYRINLVDGTVKWKNSSNGKIIEKQGILDARFFDQYILLNFKRLQVFDAQSGNNLIDTETGGIYADIYALPIISNDIIYQPNLENLNKPIRDVVLNCFNYKTGQKLWTTGTITKERPLTTIALKDNVLMLGFQPRGTGAGVDHGIIGLNALTGEGLWQIDIGKRGIYFDFVTTDQGVWAIHEKKLSLINHITGDFIKSINLKGEINGISDFRLINGDLVVLGRNGMLVYKESTNEQYISEIDSKILLMTASKINIADNGVIATPRQPQEGTKKGLIQLMNKENELLGTITLELDAYKRTWWLSPDNKAIYTLQKNEFRKYSLK